MSLISGYIKDEYAPLSIILIAEPECAKTSMLLKFNCPHTIETADLSSKPITDFVVPLLAKDELHHIIIPDMIKLLSHRETTVNSTIAFLNALMEEGIKQNLFFGQTFEFKTRKKCGLLTAVTFDFYYKMYRKWREIGFTSRFLPISYKYSKDTVSMIHDAIENNEIFIDQLKIKKVRKQKIGIPKEHGAWLNIKANTIAEQQSNETIVIRVRGGKQKRQSLNVYGFRLHKQLRKLVRSIALSDKKNTVTWEHIKELDGLIDYIRMPKNPKLL